ncbi:MAG: hypothetical protein LBB58_04045 [Cellulomonadaceae bacterium]|jgi:hypothetical protein|nr:hypothetical protein [Cellulomonadaceae bacterium]
MSNYNDPNDPNYVVSGTSEPVREYVVREETVRRVAPAPVVEVEPERPSLRWLWWLLGLLALAALAWALTRACRGTQCTAVPDAVWNQHSATAVETVRGYTNLGADQDGAIGTALRELCNARLSHTGAGNWFDGGRIQNAFTAFAPNLEAGVLTNIQNLVTGNTFCRCS